MSSRGGDCRFCQPADYKSDLKPVWCAGCGDFGALAALHRAMAGSSSQPENTVVVSGIGCSSRLPGYVSTFGFNGLHGRALRSRPASRSRGPSSPSSPSAATATASRSAAITSCTPRGGTSTSRTS